MRFNRVPLLLVAFCASAVVSAQYKVHDWANFEDGKYPANAILVGAEPRNAAVVEYANEDTTMTRLRSAMAAKETGKFGLKLVYTPDGTDKSIKAGMLLGKVLDRTTLGANGRALVQADIYVLKSDLPSVGVVAMRAPETASADEKKRVSNLEGGLYSFGLSKASRDLYFSSALPPTGPDAKHDKELLTAMYRPGWHRFAIVLEGQDTIRMYVDGVESSMSPIKDSSIQKVFVGVANVTSRTTPYFVYVDNLSIQVSAQADKLPDSPYSSGNRKGRKTGKRGKGLANANPKTVAASSQTPAREESSVDADSGADSASGLDSDSTWQEPEDAWAGAKKNNKPFLIYFYGSGLPDTETMDNLLQTDPAKNFLKDHSCARVDVNQLSGGFVAEKYHVFKVPSFLVVKPDGKQYKQAIYHRGDSWDKIRQQLF